MNQNLSIPTERRRSARASALSLLKGGGHSPRFLTVALAGLAALLAAPDPVSAQTTDNTCGAPPAGTCVGDYPNGVKYLRLGADGTSNELTLTVEPGASGESTIVGDPTGIVIQTPSDDGGEGAVTLNIRKGVTVEGVKPNRPTSGTGIFVYVRGDRNAGNLNSIKLDVAGTVKAQRNAIYIDQRDALGDVVVNLSGSISGSGEGLTRHGISLIKAGASNPHPVSGDIKVTLQAGARIGADGDKPTVGRHGVWAHYDGRRGDIEVSAEAGARIGAARTPVGWEGIWSRITATNHDGDIRITNHGEIHAKGSGIYAWHGGQGDVVLKHEAGQIVEGGVAGRLRPMNISDRGASELEDRTAGILAFHGGSAVIRNADGTPKSAEIGKVEIASGADIKSEGDGILAYVRHVDATHLKKTAVPITVDVSGGTVAAKGYGVHAETATDYATSATQTTDAAQAGRIEVTVGAGATVMAEKDGVRVAGKRVFASDHARAGQRDQKVIIHGKVMGGGSGSAGATTDGSGASVRTSGAAEAEPAGVHMVGGGTIEIGPRAELGAGSGVAVRANGALTIAMKKDAEGRIGDVMGKILNSETTFEGVAVGDTVTALGQMENRGVYDGGTLRRVALKAIEGGHEFAEESAGEYRKYHARARVYEALPSVLLDLNVPTSPHARRTAARDANGGWARVSFGDGERETDRSTTEGGEMGRVLSWDLERWSAEMGFDIPTSTEGLLLGVSAHYRDGEAKVEHGGRIEVSGFGVGASATYAGENGWYWDGQVSYTRFDDVDLSSDDPDRGMLVSGLEGDGYAVGVEVGRRVELAERELVLTPRGGLVWSSVDVDNFNDVAAEGFDGDRRVGFGSEDSLKGRVGALLESADGRLHASLDVEHELSEERSIMASGARLESEGESTWARLGVGFRAELDETGQAVLSGEGFYAMADGDNHDYGASVALRARF